MKVTLELIFDEVMKMVAQCNDLDTLTDEEFSDGTPYVVRHEQGGTLTCWEVEDQKEADA